MLVLFISDRSFGTRETDMLERIRVGLLDEGVRVMEAAPASAMLPQERLDEAIVFQDTGPRLMRRFRLRRLVDQLAAVLPADRPQVDLVHAWGGRCWIAARELALASGATLVLEVWSGRAVDRAIRFEAESQRAGGDALRGAWSAPGDAMAAALRRERLKWPIHLCPWGVHLPDQDHDRRPPDAPTTIAAVATGVDKRAVQAMLEGLARAIGDRTDVLIFIDEAGVSRHGSIWRQIRALGLADRLSVIADLESRRRPSLALDILAAPEALGEHRTLILDAMAARTAVVAQADPLCGYLIDAETAMLIADPTPNRWEAAFAKLIGDPEARRTLGRSAARYVARERRAHVQIEHILAAYRTLAAEAIPFKRA